MGNIKTSKKPTIIFYDHDLKDPKGIQGLDPPLFIIAKVYGKTFKIILVDGGSTINIISTNVYKYSFLTYLCTISPIKSFNNVLCSIVGSILLPTTMGSKTMQTLLQVIEGEDITQYNILLGRPWIKDMQCVPSTYHNCLKYIHEGVVHCVPGDEYPYTYCNTTYLPNDISLPSTHFFMMPILKNEPLVINVDKNDHTSLKEKQDINQPKLINDHQEVDNSLQPKITPTPQEKEFWEERAHKLDKLKKASLTKD